MASEQSDDGSVSFAVPSAVDDWIDAQTRRRGEDRESVCRRLLAAAHTAATDESFSDPADRDELETVRADVGAQREEFVELLEDVRSRVIQIKRETDEKAPADHDHPELASAGALEGIREDLETLAIDLGALEESTEAGFENFESILERLVADTDDVAERTALLARAVVDLRDRERALASRERRRARVEELKLAANRLGIRTANCEDCDASVDLALLTAPECPHCAKTFADVSKKTSLFGSHTLETGEPPALEGRVGDAVDADDPDEVFEAVAADAEERSR